jgi:hypothetical protein
MVYTYSVVIWEPYECTFEKKFQRVVTLCKDSGLNVSLVKYVFMKISQKTGHGKDKI